MNTDTNIRLSLLGIVGEANSSRNPSENKPVNKKLSPEQIEYLSRGNNLFDLQASLDGPRAYIGIEFDPTKGTLKAARIPGDSMKLKLELWRILQVMKENLQANGGVITQRLNARLVTFLKKVKDLKEVIKSFFGDTVTPKFDKKKGELCLTPV